MDKNSHPPAPTAPAKVTPPNNEPPKTTTQASVNLEVVPTAARTTAPDGSSAQPQRGTVVGSVPLRSVQQQPQPPSRPVLQVQRPLLPRPPTLVWPLAFRPPVRQTNPVVFGQGSSPSNQAMQGPSSTQPAPAPAPTSLVAAMHGPTDQHGAAVPPRVVRPRKPKIKRPPSPPVSPPSSPPPPKLHAYRPPQPPNMQADPPSTDEVTMVEVGSDSEDGGSSDELEMLDLNFPPVFKKKKN